MSPIPPEYQQINKCLAEAPPFVIFGHDRRRVYLDTSNNRVFAD
jgi:hypothetical protein